MTAADDKEDAHFYRCRREGPACELDNAIVALEGRLQILEDARNQEIGERKGFQRTITIIVAAGAVLQSVVAVVGLLLRARGH